MARALSTLSAKATRSSAGALCADVGKIGELALLPGRAWSAPVIGRRVRAPHDDGQHARTEGGLDFLPGDGVGVVLQRVVEQGGNRFVFAAAVGEHQAADAEEVGQIGDVGALPLICTVYGAGKGQRGLKPFGELGG